MKTIGETWVRRSIRGQQTYRWDAAGPCLFHSVDAEASLSPS